MARYILIDNYSGYIWGDSATMPGIDPKTIDAVQYARLLDEGLGEYGREYKLFHNNREHNSGYHVYTANFIDHDIPITTDGQSKDQIDKVLQDCHHIGFISYTTKE